MGGGRAVVVNGCHCCVAGAWRVLLASDTEGHLLCWLAGCIIVVEVVVVEY